MKSIFLLPILSLSLLGATQLASAQVQMESRPYRTPVQQPPAQSATGVADLPIAPYSGSAQVRAAPRAALAAAPAQNVQSPMETVRRYEIKNSDGTLSRALTRWVTADSTPIAWEASKDLPVVAAAYEGTFYGVLEQVMADTLHSQYPLHACAYDNVVRILHVSQTCQR